jgi:ribosomal protein S18 acetylase RimI-like enzyme
MDFAQASAEEIGAIEALVKKCQEALTAQGILQWDDEYPDRAFFERTAAQGTLFVLTETDVVLGCVVLDEMQAWEWEAIEWLESGGPRLIVHALAVSPAAQGQGYGSALLGFCEARAREQGYTGLRLDAFSGNASALRFYARHGYSCQGEIELAFKPAGHRRYLCYEKLLTSPDRPLPVVE